MKQLILIIPAMNCNLNMTEAKEYIKGYVGTRLIESDGTNKVPGILLKEPLSPEDKICLQQVIFNPGEGSLAFMTYDETEINVDSLSYLNAIMAV